jgi:protein TonB
MDFGAWTTEGRDLERRKRLAIGYGIGSVFVAGVVVFAALTAAGVVAEAEEEILDVKLATEPEPEPEPEPPPEPEAPKPQVRALPKLAVPTEVPDDKPSEADPGASTDDGRDPYAEGNVTNTPAPVKQVVAPPPPPPPPKPKPVPRGPLRVTENMTGGKPISRAEPSYPPEAKAAGIEGTVLVKIVISERGQVTDATVVRGPPELTGAALAAVKSWRFEPYILEGRPVAVTKIQPIRFRIKT